MRKTLFTGKTLFAATADGGVIRDFALLAGDGRILWVGARAGAKPEKDCERADLGDVFVMPGLIDAHVHILSGGDGADQDGGGPGRRAAATVCRGAANAAQLLAAGVVACRDLGSVEGYALGIRDGIRAGNLPGPMLLACGLAVCATGGHGCEISYEADGADAVTRRVRQAIRDGADVVKLMVSGGVNSPGPEPGPCELTEREIRAGVEAAHALGRKVAVHAHGNTAVRRCVEAGADSIEHGVFMSEDVMDAMKERGTFLVPTLSAPYYAVKEGLRADPDNPDHRKSGEVIRRHRDVLKRCAEKGVKIAMGTDAGCPFNPYDGVPYELVLMCEAGLSPEQALLAATRGGAELLGIAGELGSLEAGKRASFLVYRENLLENVAAATGPHAVYQDGIRVNGT